MDLVRKMNLIKAMGVRGKATEEKNRENMNL